MSHVRLSLGTLALALLTIAAAGSIATAEAAQKGAIKDGWLVTKLHSMFVNEDALSGSNIDVDVKGGIVTLQGTVPNAAARARAIAVVKGADGVRGVTDQLRIAPARRGMDDKAEDKAARTADKAAAASERAADKTARAADKAADKTVSGAKKTGRAVDDGWIKSKIYSQYLADWNDILDDSNIDVDVDNNMVTLNGTVKSAAAKARAVSVAKSTDGVKGVKDLLKVSGTTR